RRGAPLNAEESAAVERALTYFRQAAPKHTHDEEESLFPRICNSPDALAIIHELETDHAAADAAHREVDGLGSRWLRDVSLQEHAASHLIEVLEELGRLYARHIGIEDRELFPLAARLLNGGD